MIKDLSTKEIAMLIYNLIILGATTYLVFWKDASGFWYILAILLLMEIKYNKEKEMKI